MDLKLPSFALQFSMLSVGWPASLFTAKVEVMSSVSTAMLSGSLIVLWNKVK